MNLKTIQTGWLHFYRSLIKQTNVKSVNCQQLYEIQGRAEPQKRSWWDVNYTTSSLSPKYYVIHTTEKC